MTIRQCRCCEHEILPGHQHTEIILSIVRPSKNTSATGRPIVTTCRECARPVADSVFRHAQLWTPPGPCSHIQGVLL